MGRKIIACLLSGAILCGILVGCKNDTQVDAKDESQTKTIKYAIDDIKIEQIPATIKFEFIDKETNATPLVEEQTLYDNACDLQYNDKPSEAIDLLTNFINSYPSSSLIDDVYELMATCYRNLEEYDNALNAYATTILLYPSSNKIVSCYYNIAYIYHYGFNDVEKALPYYVECIKNIGVSDVFILANAMSAIRSDSEISINFGYEYEILDTVNLAKGGIYGDILIQSLSPHMNKSELEKVFLAITSWEGYDEMSLYCTRDAYKANFSESFSKENPTALTDGFIGLFRSGNVVYWNDIIASNSVSSDKDVEGKKYVMRKVNWGMTSEQVIESEDVKPNSVTELSVSFINVSVNNMSANLMYFFNTSGELFCSSYSITEAHSNKNDYLEDYVSVSSSLMGKYDLPTEDTINWKDDTLKQQGMSGLALATGQLEAIEFWDTENKETQIMHSITGDNYEIRHSITYFSNTVSNETTSSDNGL